MYEIERLRIYDPYVEKRKTQRHRIIPHTQMQLPEIDEKINDGKTLIPPLFQLPIAVQDKIFGYITWQDPKEEEFPLKFIGPIVSGNKDLVPEKKFHVFSLMWISSIFRYGRGIFYNENIKFTTDFNGYPRFLMDFLEKPTTRPPNVYLLLGPIVNHSILRLLRLYYSIEGAKCVILPVDDFDSAKVDPDGNFKTKNDGFKSVCKSLTDLINKPSPEWRKEVLNGKGFDLILVNSKLDEGKNRLYLWVDADLRWKRTWSSLELYLTSMKLSTPSIPWCTSDPQVIVPKLVFPIAKPSDPHASDPQVSDPQASDQ